MLRALIPLMALAGCAFTPPPPAPNAFYDLGPVPSNKPSSPRIDALLLLEPVQAPSWLQSNAIVYRLAYGENARQQSYAQSYWVGTPPDLFTARLTRQLAGVANKGIVSSGQRIPADFSLRVELTEFVHVFDSPQSSRGVVELRATLIDRNPRALIAQKSFTVSRPAPAPDASGAVQALSDATDEAIVEIADWIVTTLRKD
ncbi:MAG: ABC-type transport auxiliary lipoprotein family protein [Burkholderiales bacterium]